MIGWLRRLLDNGEAAEKQRTTERAARAMHEAQIELEKAKTERERRLKRLNLETDIRRRR